MICPVCRSAMCRRSKRRGFKDRLQSLVGLRPWRCRTCDARFAAWSVPAKFAMYVHCAHCGNMDLQTVSRDRVVEGVTRFFFRAVRAQAYRCDGCRHRFFSIRKFKRITPTRDYLGAASPQTETADAGAREQPVAKEIS